MPLGAVPFNLTDAGIAAVLSSTTVGAKLTDASIAAVLSSGTVGAKVAGISAGAVGSTVYAEWSSLGNPITFGASYAGSQLSPAGDAASSNGAWASSSWSGSLSGTWMALGHALLSSSYPISLFVRIS